MLVFNGLVFNRDVDLLHNVVAVGKRMENGKHLNSQFKAAHATICMLRCRFKKNILKKNCVSKQSQEVFVFFLCPPWLRVVKEVQQHCYFNSWLLINSVLILTVRCHRCSGKRAWLQRWTLRLHSVTYQTVLLTVYPWTHHKDDKDSKLCINCDQLKRLFASLPKLCTTPALLLDVCFGYSLYTMLG